MKPDLSDPTELHQRLRQQLILAQVRIMELEDARDELAPKLVEAEKMQRAAQLLADQKVSLARNADAIVADYTARLAAAEQHAALLQRELGNATNLLQQQRSEFAALEKRIAAATSAGSSAKARVSDLEAEMHSLKSTRSWRWTAWLRSLER